MPALSRLSLALLTIVFAGCDNSRIEKLERQNQELMAEIKKSHAATDYDLQAKCSKDSREWFNENWSGTSREKNTLSLTYTNHYNKDSNKCFLMVEWHTRYTEDWWANLESCWDVYENAEYGSLSINHFTSRDPEFHITQQISDCEVNGKKCQTVDEFNNLVRPYMSN